jgi:fatty-acyl-CoA synthase
LAVAERHEVSNLVIVGDAFARPLVAELDRAQAAGTPYDLSKLKTVGSSGTMWSQEVKAGLLRHADATLRDTIGSTEGGMGASETTREETVATAKFELGDGVEVFDENDQPVVPGADAAGRVAISGMVPLGYYKDPEKSAATFRTIGGIRYSFPGDWATVETDGSIKLLGRGSACINTAGEKVYPEEVEEVLKRFPGITDCLVVGLPDEQYGQRIVAVCSAADGCDVDEGAIILAARKQLAGYKLPKRVFFAPAIQRSASGKPDYPWAREIAAGYAG